MSAPENPLITEARMTERQRMNEERIATELRRWEQMEPEKNNDEEVWYHEGYIDGLRYALGLPPRSSEYPSVTR